MSDAPLTAREISLLIQSVEGLTVSIESLRREMAETYVRKDVYEGHRIADAKEGENLHNRVDKVEGYWSKVGWTIGTAVLLALLGLVLTQGGIPVQ